MLTKKELLSDSSKSVTVGKRIIVKSEDDNINTYDSVDSICAAAMFLLSMQPRPRRQRRLPSFKRQVFHPSMTVSLPLTDSIPIPRFVTNDMNGHMVHAILTIL